MFRMLRNNSNLIFLVYSNLTLLDTMVQKEFIINTLLASNGNRSISQNVNYSYVWQKSLPHPWKIKFFPVPVAVLTWNFVECYFSAIVNVSNKIGRSTTSKWEEMSFHIQQMNFAWKSGTFWSYLIEQLNVTLSTLSQMLLWGD